MKRPFWILNSALFFFIILALLFILFSGKKVPSRVFIEPEEPTRHVKKPVTIDITKIYTPDDLFGTYEQEIAPEEKPQEISLPQPPSPVAPVKHVKKPITFLDPLPLTLKGIIVLPNDDTKNRTIILDNETKQEKTYQVGDSVKDAQVIKIIPNKVVLIRSNGQQEALYLREKDAQEDPIYDQSIGWDSVITKISDFDYVVDAPSLAQKIKNIGEFIDLLDLTTVYKEGRNIGLRLGNPPDAYFISALGLRNGDIVYQVADILVTDSEKQHEAYKKIRSLASGQTVEVKLYRNNQPQLMRYTIKYKIDEKKEEPLSKKSKEIGQEEIRKEQKKLLEKKHTFAPTMREMQLREKLNMQSNGQKGLK